MTNIETIFFQEQNPDTKLWKVGVEYRWMTKPEADKLQPEIQRYWESLYEDFETGLTNAELEALTSETNAKLLTHIVEQQKHILELTKTRNENSKEILKLTKEITQLKQGNKHK